MYSDRSLHLSTPDLILGTTEHMVRNAMPQLQSTSTLMSNPDLLRLGSQTPTNSASSPYAAGIPSSTQLLVGQHRMSSANSLYRGGYHIPTTFTQPQMPGSVLQPTIPGYHVSYTPTSVQPRLNTYAVNGCQQVTAGASQQMCNTWTNSLNSSVNSRQDASRLSGLDLLNIEEPESVSEASNREPDTSDKSGWLHSVPGRFPWSQCMGHTVQFDGKSVDSRMSEERRKSRKRHSDEELNYTSKLHITEARLKDLSLHREDITARPSVSISQPTRLWRACPEGGDGVGDESNWSARRGHEMLEELDSRLQVDDDEEDANNNEQTMLVNESRLVLSQEVSQHIRTAQEILPKACIQSWTHPSMQVVLWRPPGSQISEIIEGHLKEPNVDSSTEDNGAISVDSDIMALNSQENKTDVCANDDLDDFMDL